MKEASSRTQRLARILLADDHAVVRQGLISLLDSEPDLTVVGEADTGIKAIRMCLKLEPDILVLDIMMDDINGIEVTKQVSKQCPSTAIVILSMYGDKKHVLEAFRAGVKAYVLKKAVALELVKAIREARIGRNYLSPPLADLMVGAYLEKANTGPTDPYDLLSDREREVLHMVANGASNAEIGKHLCISRRTVETHRANAMHKLNLANQTELIRYALDTGILPDNTQ